MSAPIRGLVRPTTKAMVWFTVYSLMSVLLTWPLCRHLNSVVLRGYGDVYGDIWGIWSTINGLWVSGATRLMAAPFGIPAGQQYIGQPVLDALVICPAKLIGAVAGYNLFILLSFPLTALAVYLFLRSVLKQEVPAFFGGLVFGFCPSVVMHAVGGHLGFALNAFIPLLLWALFNNRIQRSWLSALLVGTAYAFLTLTSFYWGYFAVYMAALFVVWDYYGSKNTGTCPFLRNYFWCMSFAGLIILVFEYKELLALLSMRLTMKRSELVAGGYIRRLVEPVTLSARPWEYLIPSIDHPVLGRFVERFSRAHLHGSNLGEQTLYLGFVPLALLAAGVNAAWKKRLRPEHAALFWFFVVGALWMGVMSAPPYIPIGKIKLPTLTYLAFSLAPKFRAYCRFGIWVDFFVACAAAVVLDHASQRIRKSRFYLMCLGLFLLLTFEYWTIPPDYTIAIDPPPVYQWLAKQQGDFIIAEYPMMPADEAAFYTYLFWQRVHGKRMVNGATQLNHEAWALFEQVQDLAKPETVRFLKDAGVRYVLVHQRMYVDGQIPGPIKRYYPPLTSSWTYNTGKVPNNPMLTKPYQVFGTDTVFSLK